MKEWTLVNKGLETRILLCIITSLWIFNVQGFSYKFWYINVVIKSNIVFKFSVGFYIKDRIVDITIKGRNFIGDNKFYFQKNEFYKYDREKFYIGFIRFMDRIQSNKVLFCGKFVETK